MIKTFSKAPAANSTSFLISHNFVFLNYNLNLTVVHIYGSMTLYSLKCINTLNAAIKHEISSVWWAHAKILVFVHLYQT